MANPAQLLLDQLRAWHAPGAQRSAAEARGVGNNNAGRWLAERIAVRHLDAIDELLDEMEQAGRNITVFRRHYDKWADMVFAYPAGWARGGGGLDTGELEHLENLADRLDDFVPTVRPGGLDDVRAYAEGIRTLIDEDDSIDALLKLHVKQVIAHLLWCVDNYDAVGAFDLQDAVERLASSILRAEANSKYKAKWKAARDTWVWPFVVNVIAAIPGNALAQLALGPVLGH